MGQTTKADPRIVDDVARLTTELETLRARLETLEAGARPNGNGNGGAHHSAPQSRRDLLKLAGAAAAGAAGSIVLGAVPAAATNTNPIILGNQTTNDAATTTDIFPTNAATPAPLFQATGQGVTTTTTVPPTASSNPNAPLSQSIPLIGAIGPGGKLVPIGNPAVNDYPGFAPIQGIGGTATITTSTGQKPVSEGVNGFGFGATGIGITGESDVGYGVVGGSGGIDFAALGNGRILMLPLPDAMLTTPPAGPPNYVPNDFEIVRDANGLLYASMPGGAWLPLQFGGLKTVFSALTTKLLALRNSDGATFVDMMPDGTQGLTGGPDLVLAITPAFDCYAVITGSASLYADTANYSQDIGIFVSGSTPPQGIVGWAESGGLAPNTPNAAYVEAIVPLFRGVAYDVRLKWKGNHASTATIRSGAGPFPITAGLTNVSPTRLTVFLVVSP